MRKTHRCSQRTAREHIHARHDFVASNFSGRAFPEGTRAHTSSGWGSESPPPGCTYVIWSYDTPIAWVDGKGCAHLIVESFSVTTSAHQSAARALTHDSRAKARDIARAEKLQAQRHAALAAWRAERKRQYSAIARARRRALAEKEREAAQAQLEFTQAERVAIESILAVGAAT